MASMDSNFQRKNQLIWKNCWKTTTRHKAPTDYTSETYPKATMTAKGNEKLPLGPIRTRTCECIESHVAYSPTPITAHDLRIKAT